MSAPATWSIERAAERVVIVRMNANKANVITNTFLSQFAATLDKLEKEFPEDAVVLTGNGSMFSAGLDLKFMSFSIANQKFDDLINYIEAFDNLIERLFTLGRPVIAAIEGHAIAGGTCIACACDFRLSNGKGSFGMNEVINGMSVPFNMLEVVRQAVPNKASQEIFLTGKVFDAKEALRLGVVDEIVTADQLIAKAVEKATYTDQSHPAYKSIKALLQRPVRETLAKFKGATRKALAQQYKKSKL